MPIRLCTTAGAQQVILDQEREASSRWVTRVRRRLEHEHAGAGRDLGPAPAETGGRGRLDRCCRRLLQAGRIARHGVDLAIAEAKGSGAHDHRLAIVGAAGLIFVALAVGSELRGNIVRMLASQRRETCGGIAQAVG